MEPRMNYGRVAPGVTRALRGLQEYLDTTDLEHSLLELVKVRASQINGCAFCVDMHTQDARALGETEQRLYALFAWHETPFFSDRERAALLWTETLTRIAENDVPDEIYNAVAAQFSEKEMVDLSLAVILINGWNRLALPFRTVPGSYKAKAKQQAE